MPTSKDFDLGRLVMDPVRDQVRRHFKFSSANDYHVGIVALSDKDEDLSQAAWVGRVATVQGWHAVLEGTGRLVTYISSPLHKPLPRSHARSPLAFDRLQKEAATHVAEYRQAIRQQREQERIQQETRNRYDPDRPIDELLLPRDED